jgi:hypothetical protein
MKGLQIGAWRTTKRRMKTKTVLIDDLENAAGTTDSVMDGGGVA